MANIAYTSIGGSDAVYWNESDPNAKHIAIEHDNKQTWYATVYATTLDFLKRKNQVEYRSFGFRSEAVTWACGQLA